MVARGGIEPPTRGFSVRLATFRRKNDVVEIRPRWHATFALDDVLLGSVALAKDTDEENPTDSTHHSHHDFVGGINPF